MTNRLRSYNNNTGKKQNCSFPPSKTDLWRVKEIKWDARLYTDYPHPIKPSQHARRKGFFLFVLFLNITLRICLTCYFAHKMREFWRSRSCRLSLNLLCMYICVRGMECQLRQFKITIRKSLQKNRKGGTSQELWESIVTIGTTPRGILLVLQYVQSSRLESLSINNLKR